MPALSLADLLPDFGSRAPRGAALTTEPQIARPEPAPEPKPIADTASMIAEEVAKAEAAVTERLSAIYEATLEAERKSHADERDELRRSLGTEAAALIEARFAEAEERLLTLTTTAAARILGSILTEEMQKRAVAALAAKIRDALAERDAVRVRVQGPQLLCEALETSLGAHAGSVEFVERASFDLTVNIDSSIYETRLAEWSVELAGVLA
jgi:hypothetical protein